MSTPGNLFSVAVPTLQQAMAPIVLPPKAPRASRAYSLDFRKLLTPSGNAIDHAAVLATGGLLTGGVAWTATTVTFVLAGGVAGSADPTITLALALVGGRREDFTLVQPVSDTLPDIPDDVLTAGGQVLALNAGPIEITVLPMLPGGVLPGDLVLAVRPGTPPVAGLLPAPSGAGSSGLVPFIAGAAVSGHRALMVTAAGVAHADPSAPFAFAGISTQAAPQGAAVLVAEAGSVIVEPSWSWTAGDPLFVGPLGALTRIPPTSGVLQQVAVATAPTAILVQPFPPITRS